MCPFDFQSLFDRVVADPETAMTVAAVWGSGDGDTRILAPVSRDGVEAALTPARSGGAASTSDLTPDRPVVFGSMAAARRSILTGPVWPVLITCSGCDSRLRLDAVGYRQAIQRLTAQGWRYTARPVETVTCKECLSPQGEGGREWGVVRRFLAGPAARDARRARSDHTPPSLAGAAGARGRATA